MEQLQLFHPIFYHPTFQRGGKKMLMVRTADLAILVEEWLAGRPQQFLQNRLEGIGCNPVATGRKLYVIRHGKSNWTTEWWADAICVAIGHPEYLQNGKLELYDANLYTGQGVKV